MSTNFGMTHDDTLLLMYSLATEMTLGHQGNVLIPCYSSGIIYDLLECLVSHLDSVGLSSIPIYFVSPVADQSLAYSNILAEWLTNSKQSRVYLPEEPFPHASFVRTGRVKHYPSVDSEAFSNDFKTPCIVFTGHPCLRFGEVVHFLQLWGPSSNNLIAFTEPDFPYMEALAPYQPLNIKVSFTPIDTSLNFHQTNKLLNETILPKYLIMPSAYSTPLYPHRTDLMVDVSEGVKKEASTPVCKVYPVKTGDTIKLPIKRSFARITLENLSANIVPTQIKPGVTIATITGLLEGKDNKFKLKPKDNNNIIHVTPPWTPSDGPLPPPPNYCVGTLDVKDLMHSLSSAGFYDSKLQHTPTGTVIHLVS